MRHTMNGTFIVFVATNLFGVISIYARKFNQGYSRKKFV